MLCGGSELRSQVSTGASFCTSRLSGLSTARTSSTAAVPSTPPAFSSMSTCSPESTSILMLCPAWGCSLCRFIATADASNSRWERASALATPLASNIVATSSPKLARAEASMDATSSACTLAPASTAYTLPFTMSAISPGASPNTRLMRACSARALVPAGSDASPLSAASAASSDFAPASAASAPLAAASPGGFSTNASRVALVLERIWVSTALASALPRPSTSKCSTTMCVVGAVSPSPSAGARRKRSETGGLSPSASATGATRCAASPLMTSDE
mmetsp:Transcript_11571/g.35795  ORF Transcript_11571/g.35795 Transcript_11571/m.35795 type:complete len:276 (+) Transcript_11571:1747-2574(+)